MSPECAVWYSMHGSIGVEVFDDEDTAVRWADRVEDRGEAYVAGVQYPDGTWVKRDEWTALAEHRARMHEQLLTEMAAEKTRPRPARRTVHPPWAPAQTVTVDDSTPDWVGT